MTENSAPFFYILTTTHNRPDLLKRNILSVQNQTYTHFEHVIANDSELTNSYDKIKNLIEKENIRYTENKVNKGKNRTLNELLSYVSNQKGLEHSYVVYLDDDDWLHRDALKDFAETITEKASAWIVSARTLRNGDVITENKTGRSHISYQYDYLLFKKFKGDATHCIYGPSATKAYYPTCKKNGEEWIYFCQIDIQAKGFLFLNKTGTFTDGYLPEGVTKKYQTPPFTDLIHEATKQHIITLPVLMYLLLRKSKHLLFSITNFK